MGLPGQTARGTRAAMGAVTSCTGLTNPISAGVRCMMIAGLSISPDPGQQKGGRGRKHPAGIAGANCLAQNTWRRVKRLANGERS